MNLDVDSTLAFSPHALVLAIALVGGCRGSSEPPARDSGPPDATTDSGDPAASDTAPDTLALDADTPDVPVDATYVRYERDVRPLLEASACGDCHEGIVVMDYSWMSAPGETWCSGRRYDRRWHCFEEHARTQVAGIDGSCDTAFYHRHGEPCFEEETRLRVLRWAADGYRE